MYSWLVSSSTMACVRVRWGSPPGSTARRAAALARAPEAAQTLRGEGGGCSQRGGLGWGLCCLGGGRVCAGVGEGRGAREVVGSWYGLPHRGACERVCVVCARVCACCWVLPNIHGPRVLGAGRAIRPPRRVMLSARPHATSRMDERMASASHLHHIGWNAAVTQPPPASRRDASALSP